MLDGLMLSPSVRASLTEATYRYNSDVAAAASYLEARGIDQIAAHGFLLGKVSDPIPGHERFTGMLSIPWLTPNGAVGMKFRRIDGSEGPKYDSPPGQKARLFNAQSLRQGGDLAVVCEGEFDAIMGQSSLDVPCVATPGTTWLDHWSRCFGDFDRVVVIADHDAKEDGSDPGRKHAEKVHKAISGAELMLPPSGLDLSDWVLRDGPEAVRKAVGL